VRQNGSARVRSDFDEAIGLTGLLKRRRRDVVDGNAGGCRSIGGAIVGVTVKNCGDAEAVDRFLETAATEKRVDFWIFTDESSPNRGVMQNGNPPIGLEFRQRLLESHDVIDCFLNELYDERFAPRIQHPAAEPAGECANAGETNARDFDRFAVEDVDTGAVEHFADKLRFAGLKIVVPKHRDYRDAESRADVSDELFGFFGQAVISQIAT
jgi:hypothetical protein